MSIEIGKRKGIRENSTPRSRCGVVGRKLAENDTVRDRVIPILHGTKYCNREGWVSLSGDDKIEDRSWSEGPSNQLMKGNQKLISSGSEQYRNNFDLINWSV